MNYHFKDFVFDGDQLILFKQGEAISFRANEAKLLALFLADPTKIYSKDAILDRVWSGKVVAEQAVFQNISNLRAIFGEDAIKTFSKKGYQWQLPLEIKTRASTAGQIADIAAAPITSLNGKWLLAALLLLCGAISISGVFFYQAAKQHSVQAMPTIAVLPLLLAPASGEAAALKNKLLDPLWQLILQEKNLHAVTYAVADYSDFFYTPQKYFKSISERSRADYVLVAAAGMRNNHYFLRYALKGSSDFWSAEVEAETPSQLNQIFLAHLKRITQSRLPTMEDLALMNASLKLLHRQYPDDLIILQRLILNCLNLNDPHSAILLARELQASARLQKNEVYYGIGYVALAKAFIQQELLLDAEAQLHKAADIFQREQHYRLLSETQSLFASIGFSNKNYGQVKAALQQAILTAQQVQDPLLEVGLNDYLSIMANKFQQNSDRHYFLNQAESLLDKSHQSIEHYAIVYFHGAMYSADKQVAERYYRRILEILPAEQNWWERDRAQEHLSELLIQQKRWQEAIAMFTQLETINPAQALMLAKVYSAQTEWQKAELHALSSFKDASLNSQKSLALDAALLLLNLYQQQGKADEQTLYKKFILKEAAVVPYWIRFNESALAKLGIVLEEETVNLK